MFLQQTLQVAEPEILFPFHHRQQERVDLVAQGWNQGIKARDRFTFLAGIVDKEHRQAGATNRSSLSFDTVARTVSMRGSGNCRAVRLY